MTEFKEPINWNDLPDPLDKGVGGRLTGVSGSAQRFRHPTTSRAGIATTDEDWDF